MEINITNYFFLAFPFFEISFFSEAEDKYYFCFCNKNNVCRVEKILNNKEKQQQFYHSKKKRYFTTFLVRSKLFSHVTF